MPAFSISDNERLTDNIETMRLIMPDVLEVEREVAHEKWFAYRFMSPLAATKLFASLYRQGFRNFIEQHRDREEGQRSAGLSFSLFDQSGPQLTRVWKARQHADRHGLPYDLLINFGFAFAGRRKWHHAPTPDQMFGSKKSVDEWTRKFEVFVAANLPLIVDSMPALAAYQTEHYRGLNDQDKFRRFLLDHMSAPGKPWATKLATHCVKKRHLPLVVGIGLVPESMRPGVISDIRRDIDVGMLEIAPKRDLPDVALAPACLGLVPAHDDNAADCFLCPFSTKCHDLRKRATAEMIARYGSVSPVKRARSANDREKTKLRVRAHRRKRRAEALGSSIASASTPGGAPV